MYLLFELIHALHIVLDAVICRKSYLKYYFWKTVLEK